jgi:NMD protein affecting ribosome stability and mRNA decay
MSSERRYIQIDVCQRTPISYEEACVQVRAMAASGEDNALSSNVSQTLLRIADSLEKMAQAKDSSKVAGEA